MGAINLDKLKIDKAEMGRADTLRYNVIVFVVEENYDRAINELKAFLESDSEFPKFREKVERYVNYGVDLINAIRAKRKFPGIHSLTMAKQQEITDKFHEHFNDLKIVLKKIEKVQNELRMEDIRSTVYVIKAIVNASFLITILAFLLEGARGLLSSVYVVADDLVITILQFIFTKLGF
jgi:hypothetical protein